MIYNAYCEKQFRIISRSLSYGGLKEVKKRPFNNLKYSLSTWQGFERAAEYSDADTSLVLSSSHIDDRESLNKSLLDFTLGLGLLLLENREPMDVHY